MNTQFMTLKLLCFYENYALCKLKIIFFFFNLNNVATIMKIQNGKNNSFGDVYFINNTSCIKFL